MLGGGGGVDRTMGNEAFYCDGLTLSTVVMQDLLQFSPVTMEYTRLFQFLNCCSLFYEKKLSFLGTRNVLFQRLRSNSLSEGAARSYKKREFWHQIKALLWILLGGIIFLMREKKIVHDSDWKYHSYTCE